MTAILTKEQIDLLSYKECKMALKLLFGTYQMETPITEISKQQWDLCDEITNTLLWLEDRIRQFEDTRIPSMNPGVAVVKAPPPPKVKPGKPARKYRIGDKVYENIHDAVRQTGIKLQTLKTYVSRHSDRYGYVD
jgi:hypothetical protein